jgi:hypothetical protein
MDNYGREYAFQWRGHPDGYALWPEPMESYTKCPIAFVKSPSKGPQRWHCFIKQPNMELRQIGIEFMDSYEAMKYICIILGLRKEFPGNLNE